MKTSILVVVASSMLNTLTSAQKLVAQPPNLDCPCYTSTKTVTPASCPRFTKACVVPMCIRLETQFIPGPNPRCPKTPTVTSTRPCQTACIGGCATTTMTVTGPVSCPATPTITKIPTPTPTLGKIGDRCSTFTFPPDPPCGPGLGCVLDDPLLPDMGGQCLPVPIAPVVSPLLEALKLPSLPIVSPIVDALKIPPTPIIPAVLDGLDGLLPSIAISIAPPKLAYSVGPIVNPTPPAGAEGALCGAFTWPPQPNCASGLVCVIKNPQVPDIGGTCQRRGIEGDPCNRYRMEPDPACAPGLTCVTIDPRIPDMGGICRRDIPVPTVLSTVRSVVGVQSTVRSVAAQNVPSTVRSVVGQPVQSVRTSVPTRPPSSLVTVTKPPVPVVTAPPRSRPCYTKTTSAWRSCPEDRVSCRPIDCISLSTKLVPSGPVQGCAVTPTITNTRKCLGRCDGACSTQVVTKTVPW